MFTIIDRDATDFRVIRDGVILLSLKYIEPTTNLTTRMVGFIVSEVKLKDMITTASISI